jgi:putative hydrolase
LADARASAAQEAKAAVIGIQAELDNARLNLSFTRVTAPIDGRISRAEVTAGNLEALMSLLEGHGHVVMDRIGERELLTQQRMSDVLKMRRKDPRTAMFMRLVGLEMKMKQYEAGADFIAAVERHAGWPTLDRAWESPENLPTLEEIEQPVAWLERVA